MAMRSTSDLSTTLRWVEPQPVNPSPELLAYCANLLTFTDSQPTALAAALVRRGITNPAQAAAFLDRAAINHQTLRTCPIC